MFADDSGLVVLLGNGDGTFKAPVAYGPPAGSVVIADLNNDGIPDLASGGFVLIGNGDGTFGHQFNFSGYRFLDVGDINADGKPDLVLPLAALLGNGYGTFQSPVSFVAGNTPFSTAVKDYNNDGVADVAVANFGSADVSVLLGCH